MRRHPVLLPYLLLLPMLAIMTALVFYPIGETFLYSLKQMKLTAPEAAGFIGFDNYKEVLSSKSFWYSLANTTYMVVLVTLLTVVGAILTASLLNRNTRLSPLLTGAAILPWALPPIVNGILWRFIFHPGYGFMNQLLLQLHLIQEPVRWLSGRFSLLTIISLVAAWRMIPFSAIILLAGMKTIPREIYEAASIDGSKSFGRFRYITLPLTLPFLGIGITHTLIMAVNIFDEIVSLSGFKDMAKNLLVEDYLITFSFLDFGKGSALAYIIMALSGIMGYFYIRSLSREVEY